MGTGPTDFVPDPRNLGCDPSTTNTLVDPGTDVRNNYYQEGLATHSNIGLPGENGTGYFTGLTAFEAGWQLGNGIDEGDFGAAASGAFGVGLELASVAMDPIGYAAGQCLSWMLDHIEPAREALDRVAGSPAMVSSYAQSWTNIEEALMEVHSDMTREIGSGTTGWSGAASDAYRSHAELVADATGGAAGAAHGIATLTQGVSEMVGGVRTAIRDLLSGIVGSLISWTIEITCTVGFGAPLVVAQATARISQIVRTVAKLLDKLSVHIDVALNLLTVLRDLFDGLYKQNQALQAN